VDAIVYIIIPVLAFGILWVSIFERKP